MRAEGTTISGGPAYREEDALGLPREKRETPEEVRARMEAKAARRRSLSPWGRPIASASESRAIGDALVDHGYTEVAFTTPAPVDEPDDATTTALAHISPVTVTAAEVAPRHACQDCDATFATKQGLGGHRRVHTPPAAPATPEALTAVESAAAEADDTLDAFLASLTELVTVIPDDVLHHDAYGDLREVADKWSSSIRARIGGTR